MRSQAKLAHGFGAECPTLFDRANATGKKMWEAAGAIESWHNPHPATAHMAGGTIMGTSRQDSVTDAYGRTHDIANLFHRRRFAVSDGSCRSADVHHLGPGEPCASHIKEHWGAVTR
jgi:choline dehydrogenase-like flavoprotein